MHSSDTIGNSGSDDEDSEEEGGWLSQSSFSLGPPPVSARHHQNAAAERRPLSLGTHGFDVSQASASSLFGSHHDRYQDTFGTSNAPALAMSDDPFSSSTDVSGLLFNWEALIDLVIRFRMGSVLSQIQL